MSYDGMLNHRATIQRRNAGLDRLRQPVNTFTAIASDVPCRLSNASGSALRSTESQGEVKASHSLYFKTGIDIVEDDRVSVMDRNGNVIAVDLVVMLRRPVTGYDGTRHHVEVPCTVFHGIEA